MPRKKQNIVRDNSVSVNFDQTEFGVLLKRVAASTHRTKSSYIRQAALGEPIVARTRSASHDELYELLSEIRADLKSVADSFDKAASALKGLPRSANYDHLLIDFEMERIALSAAVRRSMQQIMKIASEWL